VRVARKSEEKREKKRPDVRGREGRVIEDGNRCREGCVLERPDDDLGMVSSLGSGCSRIVVVVVHPPRSGWLLWLS
jgi:hypothetical protein